jgi:uncharacterized membrane protein
LTTDSPSKPVAESPSEPPTDSPGRPPTDSPGRPSTDSPSKPVAESPSEPKMEAPSKPVAESPSEPKMESPSEPVAEAPSKPTTEAPSKPVATGSDLKDACYVNTMIHFYRGELGRIMAWRQRLDVTTTWAITSTTSIITISFSLKGIPHIVFFFNIAYVWMLLWIEARRYRLYDAFRGRVRMVESHFLVPMILQNPNMLVGNWKRLVCEDLILPSYKISKLEAIGRRMSNYVFIFAIIIVAWTMKIFVHAQAPIDSIGAFYRALAIQSLPSWVACIIFFGTILGVIALVIYVSRLSTEEVGEFRKARTSLWRA